MFSMCPIYIPTMKTIQATSGKLSLLQGFHYMTSFDLKHNQSLA